MTPLELAINLTTTFIGTIGFTMVWNLRNRDVFLGAVNGIVSWVGYLIVNECTGSVFAAAFTGSVISVVIAEILARIRKTNATQFMICGIIPMVPGASYYNTAIAILNGDHAGAAAFGSSTAGTMLGIAAGVCLANAFIYMMRIAAGRIRQ